MAIIGSAKPRIKLRNVLRSCFVVESLRLNHFVQGHVNIYDLVEVLSKNIVDYVKS